MHKPNVNAKREILIGLNSYLTKPFVKYLLIDCDCVMSQQFQYIVPFKITLSSQIHDKCQADISYTLDLFPCLFLY